MAEKAAYFTSILQPKPSIFEIIAQENLSELLYPSFKIVVQFLASGYPQRCHWLASWQEEVFLCLNTLLQLHYLNTKGASFAESFYGLQRISARGLLSPRGKIWSLFCLSALPYLARKLDVYIDRLQTEQARSAVGLCRRSVLAAWRLLCLAQYLSYLTGRSTAHSPLLSLAHLSLQYAHEPLESSLSWRECLSTPGGCAQLVSNGLMQALEMGSFFLQCLTVWHSDHNGHISTTKTPPPPPKGTHGQFPPGICPVCKEPFKIETALATSGYVFCYRCIREAIVTKQRCPVTGLPSTLDELVRLYPSR